MLDLFLQRRANSTPLSGEVVLRVLDSVKLELLDERCQLWNEVGLLSPHDRDDISPILKGIEARVKVLESVWDGPTSKLYQKHFFLKETAFKPSRNIAAAVAEEPPRGLGDGPGRHPTVRYTIPTPLTTLLVSLRRKQWHLLPLFSSSSPQPSSRSTSDLGYRCKAIPREAQTTPTSGILFKTASWLFWATSPWLCSAWKVVVSASVWSDVDIFHAGTGLYRHSRRDVPLFQPRLELDDFLFSVLLPRPRLSWS